jgi:hypothetical protein
VTVWEMRHGRTASMCLHDITNVCRDFEHKLGVAVFCFVLFFSFFFFFFFIRLADVHSGCAPGHQIGRWSEGGMALFLSN